MTGPKGPYRQVLPGLYLDRDGAAVFNIADILVEMGMDDTPENRREVGQELAELLRWGNEDMKFYWRGPGEQQWREWPG